MNETLRKAAKYNGNTNEKSVNSYLYVSTEKYEVKEKTIHDKWRNKQLSSERIINLFEREVHNKKQNYSTAGLQFEGPLSKLAKKYKTIEEIYKHMTLGQVAKYYTEDKKIYSMKTKQIVYDEETQKVYEE